MDEARYRLREFQESDYPAEARLGNQIHPERLTTPEEIRHWDDLLADGPFVRFKMAAEEVSRGDAVGFGLLFTPPWMFDPRRFWVEVSVDRDHERQGIGTRLATALLAEATRRQAVALWASVRADQERWLRFLAHYGFEEKRRLWQSRLEVATAADFADRTDELAREGISFTTLADEGFERLEVRRRLHELSAEAGVDVPRMGPSTPISFERFVRAEFTRPGTLPEAYFLARQGDRYVAVCNLSRMEADSEGLEQDFTGVRREFRGRGIASELKRRTVEYARRHGYRYIQTFNDSLNRPMWAINEKLGYRKDVTWVQAQKEMAVDRSPSPPS